VNRQHAGDRIRSALGTAAARLRTHRRSLAQSAVSASLAYLVALTVLDREDPFFAPIAAVVCLSVTVGQRTLRAAQIALGVAVGIAAADLIVTQIGTGPLQIGIVVLLAMAAAVALHATPLLVNQAAIAAILVAVLDPGTQGFPPGRLLDALVGAAVALLVNAVSGTDPRVPLGKAAATLFADLAALIDEVADGVEERNPDRATAVLARVGALDRRVETYTSAVSAARERYRFALPPRNPRQGLDPYLLVDERLDLTMMSGRLLARAGANAVRHGHGVPEPLTAALRELAAAIRSVPAHLAGQDDPGVPGRLALQAAADASRVLRGPVSLTTSVLVGHIRSTAVDLLASTGIRHHESISMLEEAAGRAVDLGPASP
jgi:uncharacterized membrane protein YccC